MRHHSSGGEIDRQPNHKYCGCDCIVTLWQLFTPKSYLLYVSLISLQSGRNHLFPFYSIHYSNKEKYIPNFTPCFAKVIQFFSFFSLLCWFPPF